MLLVLYMSVVIEEIYLYQLLRAKYAYQVTLTMSLHMYVCINCTDLM